MAKRGPHGTLRVEPSALPMAGGSSGGAGSEANTTHAAPQMRGDEYADHSVQKFRKATANTVRNEKKVVIASRQAATLKVNHADLPALAEAIAKERARKRSGAFPSQPGATPSASGPGNAHREPPRGAPPSGAQPAVDGDTSWVNERDSFDPGSFLAEPEQEALRPPTPKRPGVRALLLLFVVAATSVGVVALLNRGLLPASSSPSAPTPNADHTTPPATTNTTMPSTPTAVLRASPAPMALPSHGPPDEAPPPASATPAESSDKPSRAPVRPRGRRAAPSGDIYGEF